MDIKKDVKINIETEQKTANKKLISVRQEALGELQLKEGTWSLTYKEPADTGISGRMTTLSSSSKDSISINKTGTNHLSLLFSEGKQHISRMTTPEGNVDVGFLTRSLKMNIGENGGTVKLIYVITGEDLTPVNTTMNFLISPTDT